MQPGDTVKVKVGGLRGRIGTVVDVVGERITVRFGASYVQLPLSVLVPIEDIRMSARQANADLDWWLAERRRG